VPLILLAAGGVIIAPYHDAGIALPIGQLRLLAWVLAGALISQAVIMVIVVLNSHRLGQNRTASFGTPNKLM
jgi:hypothetical protein